MARASSSGSTHCRRRSSFPVSERVISSRFILVAQLATAAAIDQFGLFGIARNPVGLLKLGGFALIVAGVVLVQIASQKAVAGKPLAEGDPGAHRQDQPPSADNDLPPSW